MPDQSSANSALISAKSIRLFPLKSKRLTGSFSLNPLHLAEVERDVSEVNAAVAVRVFVDAVAVGIGRGICHAWQGQWLFNCLRGKLLDAVVPVFADIDIP